MSFFSDIYPLPNGIGRAPDDIGGIYGFFLRFPSNLELGLTERNVNLLRTKTLMMRQIESIEQGLHKLPLEGLLSNSKVGEHLRSSYSLRANPIQRSSSVTDLLELDLWNDLEGQMMLAEILRESVKKCKPLYVGLAEKQTIRDRILNHYEMRSIFGKKIKEHNIGWDILGFSFMSVNPKYYSKKNLRSFEKLLQRLTNPIFSEL